MKIDEILVRNTLTDEVGSIRRSWFESPVFNPDGLLVQVDRLPGGCVDCGIAAPDDNEGDIDSEDLYYEEEDDE